MKKITIFALHLGYGGIENAIINLANMLCDNYEVEIVSIYKLYDKPAFELNSKVNVKYLLTSNPNKEELKRAIKKVKILSILKEGIKSAKVLFNKKYKTINEIKKCDADIIISSRIYISNLLSKYGKDDTIKIAQEHRHHNNEKKYINLVKKVSKKVDYIMPVSMELYNYFKNVVGVDNVKYIPHVIDYIPDNPSELIEKRVISIGRLSSEKGFSDLIDIFSKVHEMNSDWILDIVGDGDQKERLQNQINKLNLEKVVKLHGYQKKEYINNLLKQSSIYVMTSLEESFGLVLLEAGSFGIPSILFDSATGSLEIIEDGYNGFIIKERNKEKMITKINKLINDKDLRKGMGLHSRENVLKYSFKNIKKEWIHFLNNIEFK